MTRRVALVTGATRGIGRAVAQVLLREGDLVLVNGRSEADCRRVADELSGGDGTAVPLAFDVTDRDAVKGAFRTIRSEHGGLDVLVNNAGVLGDGLLGMIGSSVIEDVIAVNLVGALDCMQQATRLMRRRGGGSIVNLSSVIGTDGATGQTAYAATKAALLGATRAAAKELGPANIRVNAVAPGYIDTEMISEVPEDQHAERVASIPLGRPGTAEEVAEVVGFLASDRAAYVTGEVLGITGGWSPT